LVASAMSAAHGLSLSLASFISGSTASSGLSRPMASAPTPLVPRRFQSGATFGSLKVPRM